MCWLGNYRTLSRSLNTVLDTCRGTWKKVSKGCYEVRGKTLGIVGYGHIGSQVGVLAEMLGMKVKYFDIASKVRC